MYLVIEVLRVDYDAPVLFLKVAELFEPLVFSAPGIVPPPMERPVEALTAVLLPVTFLMEPFKFCPGYIADAF